MRSQRHFAFSAVLLLLPFLCFAQTPAGPGERGQSGRGAVSSPRRDGAPEASASPNAGARRAPRNNTGKVVQLPAPAAAGSVSVETALSKLQGLTPAVSDQQMKLSDIGQLAWAAQGQPTSPTASAASNDDRALLRVQFLLPDGQYLYVPASHSLQQTREGDLRATLAAQLLKQQNAPVGGCQIIVGGSVKDFNARYGNRARNVMLLLAGQMVQSIQLEAVALNLTFVGVNNIDLTAVRKTLGAARDVEPLYVLIVGYAGTAATAGVSPTPPPPGSFKKAVIIVPQSGFADEEFFVTKNGLESNSVQVRVASMRAGLIKSMNGVTAQADLGISDVHPADYSAIIFVGGSGTADLFNARPLWTLIKEAAGQRKVMGASGNAPGILAAAGVLKGARVTGTPDTQGALVQAGAVYTGRAVEKDGPLVTSVGPGPDVVPVFVQAVLEGMAGM